MKGQPALIVIPDITGFTEFIKDSKMKNSVKAIPSLLNQIIYANNLDLKVSEIEGDAILFFRIGEPPPLEDLIHQCDRFFNEFYKQVNHLELKNDNNEDLHNISETLGLKVILHYGLIDMVEVGKHLKLIGEDVIIAHRFLKNSIDVPEYTLLSESLMQQYKNDTSERGLIDGEDYYEHLGLLKYQYIPRLTIE